MKPFLRHIPRVLLLGLVFLWIAEPVMAQRNRNSRFVRPNRAASDSSDTAKFQLAETYLRAGQTERALAILEDLYDATPNNYIFYDRLKQAYVGLKRYDEAIQLVDARMGFDPNPMLAVDKASLLYGKGDEAQALTLWNQSIETNGRVANAYRMVYASMNQHRLFDQSIEVLERGRAELQDSSLFQRELGYLYSLVGQHERSMTEYLGLLENDDRQLSYVQARVNRLLNDERARAAMIRATEEAVRRAPLNRSFRELSAWLYLEAGEFRKAFNANRAIDRLEQQEGRVLYAFANRAADAEAYTVAKEAFEEVLTRYPNAPIIPNVKYMIGRMYEQEARKTGERAFDHADNRIPAPLYQAAQEAYREFLQIYPTHALYPEALLRIGQLQQTVFRDLGAAEATFTDIVNSFSQSDAAGQAQFEIGQIALLQNKVQAARIAFGRLENHLRIGELAERTRYETALLDFYTGQIQSALLQLEAMHRNTATEVANDAIALKVLLRENQGPDSLNIPLNLYGQAKLLERQHQPQQVVDLMDQLLTEFAGHGLADEAIFLRARALRELGRYPQAMEALRELTQFNPPTYLADRSLYLIGEMYDYDLKDTTEALAIYRQLLVDYPGSLLAPDVRARIRKLRGDGT